MADTLIQKILRRASGGEDVSVGRIVTCAVDMTVLLDIQFVHDRFLDIVEVADPDKLAIVMDHAVPAPSIADAAAGSSARLFAERHGISRFFDIGRHGIVHQVMAEQGLAVPGAVVACTDSHTCAAGAVGAAARGLGPAEILQIVCSGKTWYEVPATIRYQLSGSRGPWINGKDIFLHIASLYGDATSHAVEFGGAGLADVPMEDRRTIATQGAEIIADFTVFPADERCVTYVQQRVPEAEIAPLEADPDATYASVREVNLADVAPMVGLPGSVINNAVPVQEVVGTRVHQAFIGSCANGQLSDIETAAKIMKGHKVATDTRLIVTPASQEIYLESARRGYLTDLVEAGAVVTNPTCGACFGYHMGVLGPGESCITASTRNFRGRMGSPDSFVYMASPASVAASALRGVISDIREIEVVDA